ncbi:hypothetical protein HY214_04770 [Candidatus Roizmanbacteria bacterium]|nr:hypothetical protein [Candidatus Roizmanbacteria bacterium]
MNYYQKIQHIALVDKNDTVVGQAEKWAAHRQSLLHRAFTMILTYKHFYLLQHRKHPVFDGVIDLSFSSHQIYENNSLQDDLTAIVSSLQREWGIQANDLLAKPKKIGQIYYRAKDPASQFSDHEIDYIYYGQLKQIPDPDDDFAYGFSLVSKGELLSKKPFTQMYAPWVDEMIKKNLVP